MKTRIFLSSLIALFSVAIYPAMERLANAERGYTDRIDNVFGGEEILLIFGLFVSMIIVVREGKKEKQHPEGCRFSYRK